MWTLIILLSVALPWALEIQGYDSGKDDVFSTPYSEVGEDPIGFDDDFKGLEQEWDTSDAQSGHMGSGPPNHGNHFEKHDGDFYGIKEDGLFSSGGKSDYGKTSSGRNKDPWGGYGEGKDSTYKEDSLHGGRGYGSKASGRSYSGSAKYAEGADSEPYGYSDYGSPKDHDYDFGAKGGYAKKLGEFDSHNDERHDSSYDSHKGGYGSDLGGYDSHKGGYESLHDGYDSHKGGYDSPKGGYDSHKGGYDSHKGGYDSHKGGYDSHKGGYDSHKGGYDSHKGGYDSHRGGYDSHKGGYDSPKGGYDSPKGGYGSRKGRYDTHGDSHGVKDSYYSERDHSPSYKKDNRRSPQDRDYGRNNRQSSKARYGHSRSYDKGYTQKGHRGPRSYHKSKGYGGSDHGYTRGPSRRSRYGHHGSPKYGRKMAPLPEVEEDEEQREETYRRPVYPQSEEYEYDSADHRGVRANDKSSSDSGDTLDFGPDKGTVIEHDSDKNGRTKKLTKFGVEYIPETHHHPKDTSSYRPHTDFGKEENVQKGYGGEDVRRTDKYGRDVRDRDPTKGFDHLLPKYF